MKNSKIITLVRRKFNTFKNQITVLPEGQDIVDVIAGLPGSKSYINLFRLGQKGFAPNQKFQGDLGYIGEPSIKTPTKKPRSSPDRSFCPEDFAKKGELTPEKKLKNKEMAVLPNFCRTFDSCIENI